MQLTTKGAAQFAQPYIYTYIDTYIYIYIYIYIEREREREIERERERERERDGRRGFGNHKEASVGECPSSVKTKDE